MLRAITKSERLLLAIDLKMNVRRLYQLIRKQVLFRGTILMQLGVTQQDFHDSTQHTIFMDVKLHNIEHCRVSIHGTSSPRATSCPFYAFPQVIVLFRIPGSDIRFGREKSKCSEPATDNQTARPLRSASHRSSDAKDQASRVELPRSS